MTDIAGPVLAADGTPLKKSLNRALRRQKLRALMLIAPLLLFIMITFIVPIGQMLFRSVENQIVADVLPRTTDAIAAWDAQAVPDDSIFLSLAQDMMVAVEKKEHTRLGSRLNYETTGISSLFRKSGRGVDDMGEVTQEQMIALDPAFEPPANWAVNLGSSDWNAALTDWTNAGEEGNAPSFEADTDAAAALPQTVRLYGDFANFVASDGEKKTDE